MPDLRSELMKLDNLKFDDDVISDAPSPITTNNKRNVTEEIWNAIKARNNSNSQQIADVVNNGDMSGIATRLKQMIDRGVINRVRTNEGVYLYQVFGDTYKDASAQSKEIKKQVQTRKEKQREYNAKWRAKKLTKPKQLKHSSEPLAAPEKQSFVKPHNAEEIVNQMSIGLAKAVYLELKKVFEG